MFLLRRMGMWRPSADKRRWTDVLYDAYSTFIVVTVFWGIVSFAVAAVQQFDNPPVFSHIVCLELQCIAALLKMLDFLRQREGVRALLRRLRELPLPPGGSDAQRCVQAHAREANLVSTVYTLGGAIAYVIWYAYPLVDNARESAACRRERLSTQQAAEAAGNASYSTSHLDVDCVIFRLPTEAWYPFDVHQLGPYVIAYLHQMEFVWFAYINTNTLDCLWVALMQHVAAHARCLAERMRSADSAEAMRACVRYHQALYDATRDLQTAMGPGALAQFMASLGIICLALFATMQVDDVVRKMQFGVFVVVMAQELFLFCWYGEAVRSSSEALAAAVYDAPWLRAPPPLRRDWLLVLARAQKPFSLRTAGGFNELSRRTFLSLIQLSYSFFTVLNSTNE